jgi:hypothetical protein
LISILLVEMVRPEGWATAEKDAAGVKELYGRLQALCLSY